MNYTHYVAIKFPLAVHAYYFGTELDDLKHGELVVAESAYGIQIGKVKGSPIEISKYDKDLPLSPILRRVNDDDLLMQDENNKRSKAALDITKKEIQSLNLQMRPLTAEYSLDGSKLTIAYVADDRIDFRELLKILAPRFHCRIELRQIGPRDKSRIVGGLGVCGREVCCKRFLETIEGISIYRAKNQMLSINIPKLSGQCGKLLCCLLYEDDNYTELRKDFPEIGSEININDVAYRVASFNVFSRTVKLESSDSIQIIKLDEYNQYLKKEEKHAKTKLSTRQ